MKAKVYLPYPLPLVRGEGSSLVAFLERPPIKVITENPWNYLDWRGFAVIKGGKIVKQFVMKSKVTVLVTSFSPKGVKGDPEEAFERLLEGSSPCEVRKGFWRCGDVMFKLGEAEVEALGYGIIRTRLSFMGPKMLLDVA